jgi:hypothetical protein
MTNSDPLKNFFDYSHPETPKNTPKRVILENLNSRKIINTELLGVSGITYTIPNMKNNFIQTENKRLYYLIIVSIVAVLIICLLRTFPWDMGP